MLGVARTKSLHSMRQQLPVPQMNTIEWSSVKRFGCSSPVVLPKRDQDSEMWQCPRAPACQPMGSRVARGQVPRSREYKTRGRVTEHHSIRLTLTLSTWNCCCWWVYNDRLECGGGCVLIYCINIWNALLHTDHWIYQTHGWLTYTYAGYKVFFWWPAKEKLYLLGNAVKIHCFLWWLKLLWNNG